MPKKKDENGTEDKSETENKPETVKGYSGSQHEGQKPTTRPKEASGDAVVSPLGVTEPSVEIREKSK